MAAVIQIYQYITGNLPDGRTIQGGSLTQPKSIALGDGEVIDRSFSIAASGIVKIFDAAEDEALGDFDFAWLETDLNVLVQFTTTGDVYDVKELAGSGIAGKMGPALVLGSDDTQILDGSIDAFDGTAGTIDEIWVKNESSTATARVRLVVAT